MIETGTISAFRTGTADRKQERTVDTLQTEKTSGITLLEAETGRTYIVKEINTEDDEMNAFLFRLGCYSGEPITLISKKKKSCVVAIKDGRYSLDQLLSEAIIV